MQVDLPPDQLGIVQNILATHAWGHEVRAFGSRVTGPLKLTSDLDLCVMTGAPLDAASEDQLRRAFSESTLPFKVDICVWSSLPATMRQIVKECSVVIQARAVSCP